MNAPYSPPTLTDRQFAAMTDAAYKRLRCKVPSYPFGYTLDKRRAVALLAKQAARFRHPLYIVEPHEHGNGGWCGSGVLAIVSARDVFKVNPVRDYLSGYYEPSFGSQIRACTKPDPNTEVYLWDHEDGHWRSKTGHCLIGCEARRELAARQAEETARQRLFKRIRGKLLPRECKAVGL